MKKIILSIIMFGICVTVAFPQIMEVMQIHPQFHGLWKVWYISYDKGKTGTEEKGQVLCRTTGIRIIMTDGTVNEVLKAVQTTAKDKSNVDVLCNVIRFKDKDSAWSFYIVEYPYVLVQVFSESGSKEVARFIITVEP